MIEINQRITLKTLRESGFIGRKYPYDKVVKDLESLKEEDITASNVNSILKSGWIYSGKKPGIKKLAKMVTNPKTKELILKV